MARILIGGDICPIGRNTELFMRGDSEGLFHDLLEDFGQADLVVANLECPLIERPTPIAKTGPTFGEHPACINGLSAAGIDVLCLANNHIFDHGPDGLDSTLAACERVGIATVGAGPNLEAAGRVLVRSVGGMRIGFLAMAEREFSIATERGPGANPLDVITYVRGVAASRHTFDYLIVLLHGGAEFPAAPSPRLRNTCHFLVEVGANAVIVQHPHSVGGYESYRGGHIVYGQGALVMDEAIYRKLDSFHEGLIVALTVAQDGASSIGFVPIIQSDSGAGARRMNPERGESFLRDLAEKSRAILDDEYLRAEWRRFCDARKHGYLSALLGHTRILRRLNRDGRLAGMLYSRRRLLGTRNVILCETHREVLETIFQDELLWSREVL